MNKQHVRSYAALGCLSFLAMGTALTGSVVVLASVGELPTDLQTMIGTPLGVPGMESARHDPLISQAYKLRARLARDSILVPPVGVLRSALKERQDLLRQRVTVVFDGGMEHPPVWEVALADRAEWLALATTALSAHYEVNRSLIERALQEEDIPGLQRPSDAVAMNMREDGKVMRVTISGTAQRGLAFDVSAVAQLIAQAVENRSSRVTIPATGAGGNLRLVSADGQTNVLSLIASGQSDFARSPEARIWNIQKALTEHLNGIVIPVGTAFSFNASLGGPITLSRGWKEALGIFGTTLQKTPGGGICQAATTTYRAALFAGFPIMERRSHSLYVSYYEKGGVGMDATVFMGGQNLVFLNDTGHELVMNSRYQGTEAFVDLYGIPDGRRVVMEGPYFSTTKERPGIMRPLAHNQIAWIRRIEYPDRRTAEHVFVSTYRQGVPSKVTSQYAVTEIENVHAAAPNATAAVQTNISTN